ncbi:MAG: hypothetical protein D4Q79_00520 [Spirochaetia bacterium]|nr:MAG: hypothetical protein D4Q79_00520 [Spirochaetia bacterium]
MDKQTKIIIGIIIIAAIAVIGYTAYESQSKPVSSEQIKIGFIGPLSGDGVIYGETEKAGLEIALKEINNAGGVSGRLIKIIYEDSQLDPAKAVSAAKKLIEVDKVLAILVCSSDESFAIKPITEANKILLLTGGAFNSQLFKDGEYIFGFWPTSEKTAADLTNFLVKNYKRVAIISNNVGDNIEIYDYFIDDFQKLGGKVAAAEKAAWDEVDYKTYLTKIKVQKPEALFVNAYGDFAAVSIIEQAIKLGMEVPIYGNYAFSGGALRETLKEKAEGLIFVDAPGLNNPENPKGSAFLEKLEKTYPGYVSDWEAATRYDALYLLAQAIEKVGINTEAIRNYLHNLEGFKGALGMFHFGPHGEFLGVKNQFKQIKNGQFVPYSE